MYRAICFVGLLVILAFSVFAYDRAADRHEASGTNKLEVDVAVLEQTIREDRDHVVKVLDLLREEQKSLVTVFQKLTPDATSDEEVLKLFSDMSALLNQLESDEEDNEDS